MGSGEVAGWERGDDEKGEEVIVKVLDNGEDEVCGDKISKILETDFDAKGLVQPEESHKRMPEGSAMLLTSKKPKNDGSNAPGNNSSLGVAKWKQDKIQKFVKPSNYSKGTHMSVYVK